MLSGSPSLAMNKPQTNFQLLQALLRNEDYNNRQGLLPGDPCYVLAQKSLPFIIKDLSQPQSDSIKQIRQANALLLEDEDNTGYAYFEKRFKREVSEKSNDENFKVKPIGLRLYQSLLKGIDLRGIPIQRKVKRRGVELHPLHIEILIISGKSMKEVKVESEKSSLSFVDYLVIKRVKLHIYQSESMGSFLRRLGKIIDKKGMAMRLYHYDASLFRHCSFPRMIEYFLLKEDAKNCANEEQLSFYTLEEQRVGLDEDYLLQFFPGKLIRGGVRQMAQLGDSYVLELKDEEGWAFPEQPEYSIAKSCRFCMMRMQLYIRFTCEKCSKDHLFCSRACHYQFLLQHRCKAARKEIISYYGEDYLNTQRGQDGSILIKSIEVTESFIASQPHAQPTGVTALTTDKFGGGFANINNSCYLNASIQNLIRTSLTDQILALQRQINKDNLRPLSKAYLTLIKRLQKTTAKDSLNKKVMRQFKQAIDAKISQFIGQEQHDAHQFITFFLDTLSEQLNSNSKISQPIKQISRGPLQTDSLKSCNEWCKFVSRNNSPIINLFYGQLRSQIYCPHCHTYSHRYDSFNTISLSISEKAQKEEACTLDFFFEFNLFRDRIKYFQFETAGYLVKDLVEEALPSLKVAPDRRFAIKAYKLCYEGECVQLQPKKKLSSLKDQLGNVGERQSQLFLIQVPKDSFPLYFQFIKNKQILTYKRPLFFSQPYLKLKSIKIYNMVADYLLGMAKNYMCKNVAQRKKMEEMTKRINRNVYQYFRVKVVMTKGYVEEEYELTPNADVSNLLSPNNLMEVEILNFEHVSQTEREFSEHLVKLNRYTRVNQVKPDKIPTGKTPKNLQDCVKEQFSRTQLLSNGNQWLCQTCNQKRRVRQTIHLYKASRYLILQIKRFRQGTDGRFYKNTRKVKLEVELDLTGILENPYLPEEYYQNLKDQQRQRYTLPQVIDLSKSCRFALAGMVMHEGSIARGHYTAIFKHGNWFKYNDELVTEIEDIERLLEEPETMERLYILFYQRIS